MRHWEYNGDWSRGFEIDTDDADTIKALRRAVRANQKRPDYLAQAKP